MSTRANSGATSVDGCSSNDEIAKFYDQASANWEDMVGEHEHQGFFDPDSGASVSDLRPAQVRLIEETLRFAGIWEDTAKQPKTILDVGCGIGGSSFYLAKKYGAKCIGITLSPVQAARANALAEAQGLSDRVSFQVADALDQPFPDGQFDLVWVMETSEYMPDKAKLVSELARVASPGGMIIITAYCPRNLGPSEESLQPWEQKLLHRLCDGFHFSLDCSAADYIKLLQSQSLRDIKSSDWSKNVAPFWQAVRLIPLTWKGFVALLLGGMPAIRGGVVMPKLMVEAYKKGVMKYSVIASRKPE